MIAPPRDWIDIHWPDINVAAAARNAGVNRAYLYRLLQRHGLR